VFLRPSLCPLKRDKFWESCENHEILVSRDCEGDRELFVATYNAINELYGNDKPYLEMGIGFNNGENWNRVEMKTDVLPTDKWSPIPRTAEEEE